MSIALPCRNQIDQEHEYLRTQVDPLLMPMIEALLLYQPPSLYDFMAKFLEGSALGSMKHVIESNKSTKARRHRMVEFMSSSVLPVMDDLTQRIMQEKPSNVKEFIRDLVQSRLLNGNQASEAVSTIVIDSFNVGDRIECRFKGKPKYIAGIVESIDSSTNLYTIRYENGKVEEHIHPILLRAVSQPETEPIPSSAPTPRRDIKPVILLLGLDGAGKSTFLSTLQGDLDKEIPPSAGFSSVTFQLANGSATFYDLGGGPTIRAVWKEYFADAHAVIYFVDAGSPTRMSEAAQLMNDTMAHPNLSKKPLLIYSNKMDLADSAFDLKKFENIMQVDQYNNPKILQSITKAKANNNMVDDRLEGGLAWILQRVEAEYDDLESRVKVDRAEKKKQDAAAWQAQKERVWAYKEEREREQMLKDDREMYQNLIAAAAAPKDSKQEANVPQCSECQSKPAVTKCAASKWMPVCGECADSLKKKVAG